MPPLHSHRAARFLVTVCASLIVEACGAPPAGRPSTAAADAPAAISIPQGTYRARPAHEGVLAFLGVPYARQPVGEWRWHEAEPPAASSAIVDAYTFGPTAHQPRDENERASFQPQGEDCLSLNIWTRGSRPGRKPVLVFIHGGANVSGGTADPLYEGHNVVRDNDVVLVSINYRLGPFGFLDLSEVGGPAYARSRNLGLLDQLAALRWVRANIAAFGGDAGNITVFGESAGGSAIMRLLGMPLARGLFDKAIIESGGPANIRVKGYPKTDDVPAGRALTREMMRETGVTDLAGLVALPADAVLAAAGAVARRRGDTMGVTTWGARVDDLVLPDDVFGNIRRGVNPGVKVLIGTNEDEMLYFRLYDQDFERGLMREYYATATAMGRPFGTVKALADRYVAGSRDPKRYVDFAGEFWIRQPSILLAEGQSHHSDVFMYLWTWDSQVPGLGAAHAIELPFVFGNLRDETAVALTGPNPPAALSRRIQAAWAAFALTGNPNAAGEAPWPRYTAASRATMLLTDGPWRLVDDPNGDDRQILREMYDVETR